MELRLINNGKVVEVYPVYDKHPIDYTHQQDPEHKEDDETGIYLDDLLPMIDSIIGVFYHIARDIKYYHEKN